MIPDMILTGSRQEFLPGETGGSTITYQRKGGVFVNVRGALLIVLAALALALLVGALVYFFIPRGDAVSPQQILFFDQVLILYVTQTMTILYVLTRLK